MKWNEISAIPVPEYRVVMLYREHDLYPVVGWYLPEGEGVFILEEGGTEDDPIRRHPALTWRPTHWAELPLLPSDHEHRSAELAAVVAPDPSRSSGGCREGVDVERGDLTLQGETAPRFLTGLEAIEWAESHDERLFKFSDPTEPACSVNVAKAREIAREDPSLLSICPEQPGLAPWDAAPEPSGYDGLRSTPAAAARIESAALDFRNSD